MTAKIRTRSEDEMHLSKKPHKDKHCDDDDDHGNDNGGGEHGHGLD
jgi:hypothetical protein